MKELLEKWAQLEPDRVYVSRDETGEMLAALAKTQPLAGVRLGVMDFHALALTQAAVQEAIEARGWHWSLNTALMWGAGGFSGPLVYVAEIAFQFGNADDSYGDGDTAAEALLDAYLTALEAE